MIPASISTSTRLYVGNLDYRMPIQHLETLFVQFGVLSDVYLPLASAGAEEAQLNRGYGFVCFQSSYAAEEACSLNGTLDPLFKRKLVVQIAKQRPPKT